MDLSRNTSTWRFNIPSANLYQGLKLLPEAIYHTDQKKQLILLAGSSLNDDVFRKRDLFFSCDNVSHKSILYDTRPIFTEQGRRFRLFPVLIFQEIGFIRSTGKTQYQFKYAQVFYHEDIESNCCRQSKHSDPFDQQQLVGQAKFLEQILNDVFQGQLVESDDRRISEFNVARQNLAEREGLCCSCVIL